MIRASSLSPVTAYASRQYAGYVPGSQTHAVLCTAYQPMRKHGSGRTQSYVGAKP